MQKHSHSFTLNTEPSFRESTTYCFLNNCKVLIIQVKIVSSLPVSAFGHIDNLMMNRLRIDENGSFIPRVVGGCAAEDWNSRVESLR